MNDEKMIVVIKQCKKCKKNMMLLLKDENCDFCTECKKKA